MPINPTTTTTPGYEQKFNEMLQNFDKKKEIENYLLLQTSYPINKSITKWVAIGSSPAQDFKPIVKLCISKPTKGIPFSSEEWFELMTCVPVFNEFFLGQCNVLQYTFGYFVIDFVEVRRVKMIKLTLNESTILLNEKCIKNLMELECLIRLDLNRIHCANVRDMYNFVLNKLIDVDIENVESTIKSPTTGLSEMQSKIAYELIYFNRLYLYKDLNIRKLYSCLEN